MRNKGKKTRGLNKSQLRSNFFLGFGSLEAEGIGSNQGFSFKDALSN